MPNSPLKLALARSFEGSGLNSLLHAAQRRILGRHMRAINYHDVPRSRASDFESQIRRFAQDYQSVDLEGLRALMRGEWRGTKPGLLITFDDGLRSHADVAAPILERYGFSGWFMVPIGFVTAPPSDQARWAREHQIDVSGEGFDDDRVALSQNDLVRLAGRHVVGCHTQSHRRLGAGLDESTLRTEIPEAREMLEKMMGTPVSVFTWVGGEEHSYSSAAAKMIRDAGFEFGFMTNSAPIRRGTPPLQLQRSNIEADFPIELTRLVLSGFYDLIYWPKRRRVNRLTASGPSRTRT